MRIDIIIFKRMHIFFTFTHVAIKGARATLSEQKWSFVGENFIFISNYYFITAKLPYCG